MRSIALGDGGFEAWRAAARELLAHGVPPAEVRFGEGQLPLWSAAAEPVAAPSAAPPARVPAAFLTLGRRVACHRDPGRWDVLYRLLWRVAREGAAVLGDPCDRDALAAECMARSVRQDVHRLHALVRFRRLSGVDGERYVAFHRPEHRSLPLAAPFFVRRFAAMRWSILTPDASAHWDGRVLSYGPGAACERGGADDVEALWRAYYASTFIPARANPRLMRAHLPRRHWETLPEAREIAGLLRGAACAAQDAGGSPAASAGEAAGDEATSAAAPEPGPERALQDAPARCPLPHTRG